MAFRIHWDQLEIILWLIWWFFKDQDGPNGLIENGCAIVLLICRHLWGTEMWNWFQTDLWISRCTSLHSPIFKYSCIYKEKEIEERKKKKFKNGRGNGFKQTFGRSPISQVHFSALTHLQILVQRKRNYRFKKRQKKQMVQDLVSKRPLDLPSQRCTSEHSPIFKQLCAPR